MVFSCEFCENFKNTFCTEHFWATASVIACLNIYYQTSEIISKFDQ